ncbi:MAG: DUF72 domain-containing protein [Candidatus Thermoplasmatota archaeon]|nr:DUF72 domain-containing protein [Candidatus Thermoplasmatota archaeon]
MRVGTGGWAYFQIPGMDSLEAYARAFDYVEVNSTFYQIPPLDQARSWRRRVPDHFAFTVRCHRGITHAHAFDPTDRVVDQMEAMVRIAQVLRAQALHLLTPPTFRFGSGDVDNLGRLLDAIPENSVPLALEARAYGEEPLPADLRGLMEERGIMHSVDISKGDPQIASSTLYTRLFGKGYHTVYQFSDEELQQIHDKAQDGDYRRALFTFHGVRMYSDAGRFLSRLVQKVRPSAQAPGQQKLS